MIIKTADTNKAKPIIAYFSKAKFFTLSLPGSNRTESSFFYPFHSEFNNSGSKNKETEMSINHKLMKFSRLNFSAKVNKSEAISSETSKVFTSEEIFHSIYDEFKFDEITSENKKEKILKGLMENKNFIYGEANFNAMVDIINFIEANDKNFFEEKNRLFLDIGSGTGKAVIAMSLLNKFAKCLGVELMENLHFKSELAKEKLINLRNNQKDELQISEVEFVFDDILNTDFAKFDVIFANSTCWTKDFISDLYPKFAELEKGAFIFNTDQVFYPNLCTDKWKKYDKFITQMSWGDSKVYSIRKL